MGFKKHFSRSKLNGTVTQKSDQATLNVECIF